MNYLMDVNALVAWGWSDHADHDRVDRWIAARMKEGQDTLLTSAIPELGFVRVSVQRSQGCVSVAQAGTVLAGLLNRLGKGHEFLADDQHARSWPAWCQGAARTTDAHLLALAKAHRAELATLDTGIPGAFVIP
jgi:predicted nucleic acid-binding protein